jgi:valyl-tRNA synthetase
MYAAWPLADETLVDRALMEDMAHLLEVVRAVRNLRHSSEPRARRQPAEISSGRALLAEPVGRGYLATLAQLELNGKLADGVPQAVVVVGETTVRLGLQADGEADRKRLHSELQKKEAEIASLEGKLDNPNFRDKAPKAVVDRDRTRLAEAREAAGRLRALLGEMPKLR